MRVVAAPVRFTVVTTASTVVVAAFASRPVVTAASAVVIAAFARLAVMASGSTLVFRRFMAGFAAALAFVRLGAVLFAPAALVTPVRLAEQRAAFVFRLIAGGAGCARLAVFRGGLN